MLFLLCLGLNSYTELLVSAVIYSAKILGFLLLRDTIFWFELAVIYSAKILGLLLLGDTIFWFELFF